MGVENSYTMEASFCGSSLGSRANTHLTVKDFEDIGQTFCETLLDYYNEGPRNVSYYLLFSRRNMFAEKNSCFIVGKNEIKNMQSTNGTRIECRAA